MKKILYTVSLIALSFSAMAQNETIMLWPAGKIPNAIPNSLEEKAVTTGGITRLSNVTVPNMVAFIPAKDKATGAAVLICPGGGYGILAYDHEGTDLAAWFKERGIAAFVLKYRLPNEKAMTHQHEVPLMDAMQGMKMIRRNANKYNVKPDQIGIMGFSAGGHLAATLSTHFDRGANASEEAKPNFALLLYPVITFLPEFAHGGSRKNLLGPDESDELVNYYSNELMVSSSTPPTFLVHAEDDGGVPVENSINYFLALKQYKIPAELHIYPTGGHGFAMKTAGKGSVDTWTQAMENFLKSRNLMK
ncbi:alpha/beta hydrolase [Salmonirosea aquatica]|uniref:Alpha/beta hydrolase fold domain-containing protein n=1 Tax=Salmonirosea aquatica TaxID=2654236 RepID=A0A7C9FQY1_9BACT|nr:alpha/beta hydrolase fold domain-containing protein [Cytophagaceae bacterium SJW1-29]